MQKILGAKLTNVTDDAIGFRGVILTTLSPDENSREEIAKKNFGNDWKNVLGDGKVKKVIRIALDDTDCNLLCGDNPDDEIWIYKGDLNI